MAISLEIISDIDKFYKLELEWNALWLKAKGAFYQSYSFCKHGITQYPNRKLFCVTLRDNGELVLVWALMKFVRRPCTILRPLGPGAAEPHDVLADPAALTVSNISLVLAAAYKYSGCDILNLPFVRVGSLLEDQLPKNMFVGIDPDFAPFADIQDQTVWNEYFKLLGTSNSRQQLTRKKKRLAELGKFAFVEVNPVTDPEEAKKLICWMLNEKQVWAERTGKQGYWLSSPEYRRFLIQWCIDPSNIQQMRVYALTINGEPVTVKVIAHGTTQADLIIGSYHSDPKYGKYSPGNVIDEFWIKIAFEKRLNVDFGLGRERYKLFWSRNNEIPMATYQIPLSMIGRAAIVSFRSLRRFKQYLNDRKKTEVKTHDVE